MMKKLLFLLIPGFALAQSTDQNFVKTTIYKDSTQSSKNIQVTYFDGLGRPIQKVDNAQSNSGKDIVTHIEYDEFGRQVKDFLPYPTSQNTMQYINGTTANTATVSYYQGLYSEANPYSEKQLETSPLNRLFKQSAPGNSWAMGGGHEIKFDYQTNTDTEVKLYQVTTTWNNNNLLYDISILSSGNYQANELYKTVTKDENWTSGKNNTTEEFKDKEGKVILKRTFNNSDQHDTYYVYDIYGNLTYVIPPLANGAYDDTTLNGLCYQYKYDYRNRLTAKKLPGKQWEYIVYDKLDRPVATGPVLPPLGSGTFGILITEYDAFGRVTQTGWKAMSITESTRSSWQTNITNGNNPFTLSTSDVLTVNYYDNYSFAGAPSVGGGYASSVKGLQTGSWVKVLDPTNPNASELSYTLYDYKYRPIVTHTNNHLGGYTRVETTLDWAGKTLQTITRHKRLNGDTELVVKDIFQYTSQDRLELHKQQINNLPEQLIAKNTYDELGQLLSKNVGGNDGTGGIGLQKVDYKYNIRGWLTDINDITNLAQGNNLDAADLFAFRIGYNTHNEIARTDYQPILLFNGNISETYWRTNSDNTVRKYNYGYDSLNRLLGATYAKPQSSSSQDNYKESISYDKNGNILTLGRNGDLDSDGSVAENIIDDLAYNYDPNNKNQLMKVLDMSNSPKGFTDDSDGINDPNDDYEYDVNGNLTKDDNKDITKITYNHLNLPTKIEFGTGNKINYIYNALGQKVRKDIIDLISSGGASIDYLTGFQYKGGVLQFFPHAEGYVNNTIIMGESNYNYVFNYTDHLGNIRLSYGIDPETNALKIIEENHYYPFGLKHTNYNSDWMKFEEIESGGIALKGGGDTGTIEITKPIYKYKYNGKEFQDELGLNMYDYGARNYDPALGRWMNIDPKAEVSRRWSPYTYAYNNPMYFVDPDGMLATPPDWYLNKTTNNIEWKAGSAEREGYSNLGSERTVTYSNCNTYRLNSDGSFVEKKADGDFGYYYGSKAIVPGTGNTITSGDLNPSISITDGFGYWGDDRAGTTDGHSGTTAYSADSSDVPTLGNGDGTAGSIFSKVDNILSQIIKFFEVADAAGDTMDRVGGVLNVSTAQKSIDKYVATKRYGADTTYQVTDKIDSVNNDINLVTGSRKADSIIKSKPNAKKEIYNITIH